MTTAAWNKERERLERAVAEAAERLLKHSGAESLLLPLPGGQVVAVGERQGLARMLNAEPAWTPYPGDD